jgi:hypothetical protein
VRQSGKGRVEKSMRGTKTFSGVDVALAAMSPLPLPFEILHPDGAELLPEPEVLDRMSGRRQGADSKLAQLKKAVLVEAAELLEPVAIWVRAPADHFHLLPEAMARAFSGTEAVLALVCTIGKRLETRSQQYFAGRECTRGYLLDLIGTLAVARLSRNVAEYLRGRNEAVHWAPGDDPGDMSLDAQRSLFDLVPAHRIGVGLSGSNVMVPVKSLSFFLIIGANTTRLRCSKSCLQCAWNGMCDMGRGRNEGEGPE